MTQKKALASASEQVRYSPAYYKRLRNELEAQGRTLRRYCRIQQRYESTSDFLYKAHAADWKTFWQWVLNEYHIRARSTLQNYWRLSAKIVYDRTGSPLDPSIRDDVGNYLSHLQHNYGLRKLPKPKPLITGVDDLYHLLHALWVLDESVFADEHQRTLVATGLLAGVYFGVRLVSLFDTRVKVDDLGHAVDIPYDAVNRDVVQDSDRTDDRDTIAQCDVQHASMGHSQPRLRHWKADASTRANDLVAADADSDSDSDSDDEDKNNSDVYIESASDFSDSDEDGSGSCTGGKADNDTDTDIGTDDDYDGGAEETGAFLYRHFTIFIAPHPMPEKPNMIFMKATLLHTKGEDSNPRIKTITVDSEEDDLAFSLVDHLISLALYDDAFEAESAKTVQNLFWAKMPEGKESLVLKWRRSALDRPVFRQPLRAGGTSSTEPLRASTWASYLRKLGKVAGFRHPLTQYWLRRGLLNTVNSRAPSSVRDQLFDHKIGAVRFYLDQEIRCDTKACFLGRPSNEIVQKMARCAILTADMSAPTGLSAEQQAKLKKHPTIVELRRQSKVCTQRLHAAGYKPISTAEGTLLYAEKKKADARLNSAKMRLRGSMIHKVRERHFRSADTRAFDAQFSVCAAPKKSPTSECAPASLPQFDIPERAELVRLTYTPAKDLSADENLARRIRVIEVRAALCRRRESRRSRSTTETKVEMETAESDGGPDHSNPEQDANRFPLRCKPTQCTFCLGNDSLAYRSRTFTYRRRHKMWNHVEKDHLSKIGPDNPVPCRHPLCMSSAVVLPNKIQFKAHTATVHGIELRPTEQ